ncbi:MAG: hypothetical protein NY202_03980 [Mollicutes bacterium UO1]
MAETRNIVLIGRTGSGKSSLGNVLINKSDNFAEVFEESGKSISATKGVKEATFEVDLDREGKEKIKYRIIDTIGIGDTKLTPQGVLMRLAEIAGRVKKEGLNQILFVTKDRFTKEEIEAYDLLSSIIFDKNVVKYTTIVRTGFPEFEEDEVCEEDRQLLREENADLAHIIRSVNIIYLDNPPINLVGSGRRVEQQITLNKEARKESRRRLLTYLATCEDTYRPDNIDTLDERVRDYATNEEKLQKEIERLEKIREEQAEKFRKEMAEMREQQEKKLKEVKEEAQKEINKAKVEGEENLRKTKNELEDKHRRDMDSLERKNKDKIDDLKGSYERETQSLKSSYESQMRTLQDQNRQAREAEERLLKQLQETKTTSASEISTALTNFKANNDEIRKKELDIEKEKMEREEARKDKLANAEAELMKQRRDAEKKQVEREEAKQALEQRKSEAG